MTLALFINVLMMIIIIIIIIITMLQPGNRRRAFHWEKYRRSAGDSCIANEPPENAQWNTPTVDMYAAKPDICLESRFLPTPPALDAPVRGVPVGIAPPRLVWEKLEWCGYLTLKTI